MGLNNDLRSSARHVLVLFNYDRNLLVYTHFLVHVHRAPKHEHYDDHCDDYEFVLPSYATPHPAPSAMCARDRDRMDGCGRVQRSSILLVVERSLPRGTQDPGRRVQD